MATEIKNPVLRLLVYGHLWLAVGAAAQVWWIGERFGSTGPHCAIAVALALLAVYGAMRLVRASEPDPIPAAHITWVRQHRSLVVALTAISGIGAIIAAFPLELVLGRWSYVAVPLAALYLVPWRDAQGRSRGLRQVPFLKAPLIALVWTIATVGLSEDTVLLAEHEALSWVAVPQFCLFLALAIAFDIPDVHFDRPGLRTIPQVLGVRHAKVLSMVLLLPWCAFLAVMLAISYTPIEPGWREARLDPEFYLPLIGFVITGSIIAMANTRRSDRFYKMLLDGTLILIPILAWLGSLL